MNEHFSRQYESELGAIRTYFMRMGALVEEQVRSALGAFADGNQELIELIIARDKDVDEIEIAIDDACTLIVARRQPTAIDLRMIMAVGKTVTDLERIGDEAKKIAKATRKILRRGMGASLAQITEVRHIGEQAAAMLHEVLDAFILHDIEAAARIVRHDKEIDRHFREIVRQLVAFMMEDPHTIATGLDIIFITKSVERIGDHCKNIAEDVLYIANGRDVRRIGLDALERGVKLK